MHLLSSGQIASGLLFVVVFLTFVDPTSSVKCSFYDTFLFNRCLDVKGISRHIHLHKASFYEKCSIYNCLVSLACHSKWLHLRKKLENLNWYLCSLDEPVRDETRCGNDIAWTAEVDDCLKTLKLPLAADMMQMHVINKCRLYECLRCKFRDECWSDMTYFLQKSDFTQCPKFLLRVNPKWSNLCQVSFVAPEPPSLEEENDEDNSMM